MDGLSRLARSTPEAQGIPSTAITAFLDAVEEQVDAVHSLMLLRHGQVVAEGWWEPYGPQYRHMFFSLSKSFTSTAIGMLVAEGRLSIDAAVLDFFPDEAPPDPAPTLRAMRVRHLLSMASGHAEDTFGAMTQSGDWARTFLSLPVAHEPGTRFVYNTGATYMLSAILQRLTGTRLLDYLRPRLLEPLGITAPLWETSPQGIDVGGSGLSDTTDTIARFGQFYLQGGVWQGQRLLPESWVEAATDRQIATDRETESDWAQGYGYQFWRCRHDAYRGDGAFGQFCIVFPAQDAVLALTSGTATTQRLLDLVWEHLLPAMTAAALPDDPAAHARLTTRLTGLRLPPQPGLRTVPLAAQLSGKAFAVAPNDERVERLTVTFSDDGAVLALLNAIGEQRIPCGYDTWLRGSAGLEREGVERRPTARPIAVSGAWTDSHTYVARLYWYETPFGRTLTCRFADDRVTVDQQMTVTFGPTERPRLEGYLLQE